MDEDSTSSSESSGESVCFLCLAGFLVAFVLFVLGAARGSGPVRW